MTKTLASLALLLAVALPVHAHDYWLADVHVIHPWARATPPGAPTGAVYVRLEKRDPGTARLLSASAEVADKAELHTHLTEDGVMKMRPVDAIEVAQGAPAELAPGGLHVMLVGLKQPLVDGMKFPMDLEFEGLGKVTIQVHVEKNPPAAPRGEHPPSGTGHGSH